MTFNQIKEDIFHIKKTAINNLQDLTYLILYIYETSKYSISVKRSYI